MSNSSIFGGEAAATRAAGRDADALGPSDSSDSGSDVQGERPMATGADAPDELGGMPVDLGSDSDSTGTGERGAAAGDSGRQGADIMPDRIVGGLGAEEPDVDDVDEGVDVIDDIVDDDADDADAELDGSTSGAGGDGRVFRVPSGTLDETDGR